MIISPSGPMLGLKVLRGVSSPHNKGTFETGVHFILSGILSKFTLAVLMASCNSIWGDQLTVFLTKPLRFLSGDGDERTICLGFLYPFLGI